MNPFDSSFGNSDAMPRRTFVKGVSAVGLGLALGVNAFGAVAETRRRRYAIVGVGSRSQMYQNAIEKTYREHAELVAICDNNPGRLEVSRARARANGAPEPKAYAAADFDRMITTRSLKSR
jgi:hypothetical protein